MIAYNKTSNTKILYYLGKDIQTQISLRFFTPLASRSTMKHSLTKRNNHMSLLYQRHLTHTSHFLIKINQTSEKHFLHLQRFLPRTRFHLSVLFNRLIFLLFFAYRHTLLLQLRTLLSTGTVYFRCNKMRSQVSHNLYKIDSFCNYNTNYKMNNLHSIASTYKKNIYHNLHTHNTMKVLSRTHSPYLYRCKIYFLSTKYPHKKQIHTIDKSFFMVMKNLYIHNFPVL